MVVLREPELVAKYRNEVLEVLGEKARVVEGGKLTEAAELHFSPEEKLDAVIAKQLGGATKTIDVAMFTLTSQPVADALVAAAKRGVAVRVVTEGKQSASTGVDEKIRAAGALVVEGRNKVGEFSAMHHKYAVVDGVRVLTGASNWTLNGTRQSEEDLMVLDAPDLAREYEKNFADLLHVYAGQDAPDPPAERAGVLFHVVQPDTKPGDRVVVVGNVPALGSWNPHEGIDMGTSDDLFPSWTARTRLAPGAKVEWKFVTIRASGAVEWEPGANRSLAIPASGRGTVIEGNYGDTGTSWTPAEKP